MRLSGEIPHVLRPIHDVNTPPGTAHTSLDQIPIRKRVSASAKTTDPFTNFLSNIRATQPLSAADTRAPGKQRRLDDVGVRKWKGSNIITRLGPQSLQ